MVSAPYERKNKKKENIAVRAVKAYISKSILTTYGRFSRGRSHMMIVILPHELAIFLISVSDRMFLCRSGVSECNSRSYLLISYTRL